MSSIHTKMTAICDAIREKTGGTELLTLDDMATEIAGISTGVELNFEVVGGTTEPNEPKENTIWIETDAEITSWIFSTTEPTESEEGMIWIYIDKFSSTDFNALKENGIQIYPISAMQYISGVWMDKTAKSYWDGEWKAWLHFENIALTSDAWTTGGFGKDGSTSGSGSISGGKITLEISASNTNYGADAWAYTKVKMDLSRVKTIEFTATLSDTRFTFARAGVTSNTGITPTYLASVDFSKSTSQQTKTLDVTDITEGYIHFNLRNTTTTGTAYCKEIISLVRIETT